MPQCPKCKKEIHQLIVRQSYGIPSYYCPHCDSYITRYINVAVIHLQDRKVKQKLTISTHNGKVTKVTNLPEGWDYEVDDL